MLPACRDAYDWTCVIGINRNPVSGGVAMDGDLIQKVAEHDLFRGMARVDIELLMSHAAILTYGEDQSVFETGAEERALYFLLNGTVEITLTAPFVKEVILDELNPVSVFGESTFFHSQPHSVTARALGEVTVARLERADYDRLLETNTLAACRLGANAAEILAAKLQHTDSWIGELLQAEEAHRVQKKWWDFRQTMGHSFDRPEGGGFTTGAGWR